MTAAEVEQAVKGDLREQGPRAALLQLWRVFERHAAEAAGGAGQAQARNVDERPRQAMEPPTRGTARTLYSGESAKTEGGKDGERRASLATERDAEEETAGLVHVSPGRVARRVGHQLRMDREGGGRRCTPASDVHSHVRYDGEGGQTWRDSSGAGYDVAETAELREDPVMRLLMRNRWFEEGGVLHTPEGATVRVDEEERAVLLGKGTVAERDAQAARANAESAQVGRVAAGLHLAHDFTDAWATDGSKKRAWHHGAWQTRVACGAVSGVTPTAPAWFGEPAEEGVRRGLGEGMCGQRLPACYEVVDAELHAILMALQKTGEREAPETRRCLILSDSLTALEMVERAWRGGVTWHGPRSGRAALLHAINSARARLQLVVTVWTPAHRGVAANAYADAAAKAYLSMPIDEGRAQAAIMRDLPTGRLVQVVAADGGLEPWPETRFAVMREAVGWWVRRREMEQTRTRVMAVAKDRLGAKWAPGEATRAEAVWTRTGARTAASKADTRDEDDADAAARTLVEVAEAQAKKRGGRRAKRRKGATGAEMADDRERCGMAMAARAGELWEGGTWESEQGCPACCSRGRGWGWNEPSRGKWRWQGPSGQTATRADMWHVTCGACEGVPATERAAGKEAMRGGLREMLKVATRKGPRGAPNAITSGREALVRQVAAAQRALAKGARATDDEREAMRACVAGELPVLAGEDSKRVAGAEQRLTEAVRALQHGATQMRRAWAAAGKEEAARRATREGGREGARWRGVGWEVWRQGLRALDSAAAAGSRSGGDGNRDEGGDVEDGDEGGGGSRGGSGRRR